MPTGGHPAEGGRLLSRSWERARNRVRRKVNPYPAVYNTVITMRPTRRHMLATRRSTLVIEGFPRTGNTYAVAAFMTANPSTAHIGRHLHAPAHVHRAVRYGLPTLVLIRDPLEACSSYLIRRPALTVSEALREYVDFYSAMSRYRAAVVVGDFPTLISDYGAIIRRMNRQFGTSFVPYRHTEENERRSFALVEAMNRQESGGSVEESAVARPSSTRERRKQQLDQAFLSPRVQPLLSRACSLYSRYRDVSSADDQAAPERGAGPPSSGGGR